jgi:hypothetical protein
MVGLHVSIRPVTRRRAVLLLWLLLTAWTSALYLRAALQPPPGRAFAGTFHWIDDFYNYVSYVQQAEDGAFVFRNKLLPPADSRPELVNLEWWVVGRLSLLLGHRPFLAYRLFALAAVLALVAGVERWLSRAGVPDSHRLPALLLVLLGGGFGGLLFELTDLPVFRCLDVSVAFFPFLEILANPHFAAGTALLVWALWAFCAVPGPRGVALGTILGTVLGLVRPYDLALLGAIRALAVATVEPPRRWVLAGAPLLGLVPVLAYDLWLFFGSGQFASFRRGAAFPPWGDFVPALGPALALALVSLRGGTPDGARAARAHLWAWAAIAGALVAARPGAFSLQLLVGAGVPLLVLGAAGLARYEPARTALVALALSSSAVVATRVVLSDDPNWFVPRERLAAGLALRDECRPGDRVLAPPDIGLYIHGLTACHAFVSHPVAPGYPERLAETKAFYAGASPAARAELVDRQGLTHLVLPGYAGPRPAGWLGEDTTFRAVAHVGRGPGLITIYARPRPDAPGPGPEPHERLR